VSRQQVSKLVKSGVLVVRNGKLDAHLSDAVLNDQAKLAMEAEGTEKPGTYSEARYQRELYTGKLRRLEFEARAGTLIPAEKVTAAWGRIADLIRTRLAGIPSRLAPHLAAVSDVKQVRAVLDREMETTLKALAEGIRHAR